MAVGGGGVPSVGEDVWCVLRKDGVEVAHKQSIRQAARREAFERQTRRRQEQAARDKRRDAATLRLVVALRERGEAEQRAGDAIAALVGEGLTPDQIAEWVDGELSPAEVARLHIRRDPAAPDRPAKKGTR